MGLLPKMRGALGNGNSLTFDESLEGNEDTNWRPNHSSQPHCEHI